MYIEIKNFGPIDYLNIDLEKDLHLIYGKNAIGKSYAIYCVYCLLKSLRDKNAYFRRYRFDSFRMQSVDKKFYDSFSAILNSKDSKERNSKLKNITKIFLKIIKSDFKNKVLNDFQTSLLTTFSSLENLKNGYTNKDFEITINLPNSKECKKIRISKGQGDTLDADFDFGFQNIEFVEKPTKTTKYSIYVDGKKLLGKPTEEERIQGFREHTVNFLSQIYLEVSNNLREIYFLPASRSGLYQGLSSFAPIIAELTQSRVFISKKIELPTLPEPVSDYYIDLSTVNKKHLNKEFESLVKILETKILKGHVDFDEETRNIIYEPSNLKLKLNLSEASSMVSELSPFVLYLRHIINHKFTQREEQYYFPRRIKGQYDIIFIEEPEAHLHPEVQVELMKVFAELIKSNLKIFITSHSNYMFHELNNIILDKEIDTKKIAVYHLTQTENGSTQNEDMNISPDGIDDENFQEISEKLYEERMRILEEAQ
ncbi:MAG: AAA family ATPase [Nitrosopumilus sp.]|nr:AAA family ATPase [Nitrosopumilus sp.]